MNVSRQNFYISEINGAKRVVLFCLLMAILPTVLIILPLYLRHVMFADVIYPVSESDVVEIHQGLSTVFCQSHSLKMNRSFNAFQVDRKSVVTNSRKHIRLKKSMTLPDDTLEYWGFYLLKGAVVELKVCSRYDGSNLLVIKGDRKLNTCGLLNDYASKVDAVLAHGHEKVSVTFESENNSLVSSNKSRHDHNMPVKQQNESNENSVPSFIKESGRAEIYERFSSRVRRFADDSDKPLHNPNHVLDRGVNHGGNALNYSEKTEESAASSFENGLLQCYDGNILLNQEFPASKSCLNTSFLETPPQSQMRTTHEVVSDGYYYYIFYSDNDITYNNIFAIFDISKPTFQYANMSEFKSCLNQTECTFTITLSSEEIVIVEVPTLNGIEEEDNVSLLTSTCHPRMGVYIIFPTAVLFVILGFAFV